MSTIIERYSRALRLTAPNVAANVPAVAVEGYWLDGNLFYFLAERIDASLGRIVSIPSIADCEAGHVQEVLPLDALADLITRHAARRVDVEALSGAEFDMPAAGTLAVSVEGMDFLIDSQLRCVVEERPSLEMAAVFSPDGRYACFVKGPDLWLKNRATGDERALTTDGATHYAYGQPPETSLAAVTYRKRPSPIGIWSPDSQWFLTHRIDERSLPELGLIEHAPRSGGRPALHRYKYAMPGDPLPLGTYLALHVASGRRVVFDELPLQIATFSPFHFRQAWFSGTDTAWAVRLDRFCQQAELIRLDLVLGTGRIVLRERAASGYFDVHSSLDGTPNIRILPKSNEVIWFSERDGWGHLYLYDAATGHLKNRITQGNWAVRDIVQVDEEHRKLLLLVNGLDASTDSARRSLCAVNLDGSGFEVLFSHDGDVFMAPTEPCGLGQDRPFRPSYARAGVSPDGRFGVLRFSSVTRGNVTKLVDLQTREGIAIASASPASDEVQPRPFTARAADGVTPVYGVMFLPSDFDEKQRYPLIDYIYPGPQMAHQPQAFGAMISTQARTLAELGFVTLMLDTRGMPIGSRAFHQAGYPALLEPQVADHAAVVRHLCESHPFIDGNRCGMIGASGGGAATVRALCDYGEIFKVGVAVCGNHDSARYAALWSDKYRGAGGREGWTEPSNNAVAHQLKGQLLLISGDMDENVHVSHTLSLVDALIRANKNFDLLIVPNEGHAVLWANGYAQRRAWDYFVRHLRGEPPPPDFEINFEPQSVARFIKRWLREARQ